MIAFTDGAAWYKDGSAGYGFVLVKNEEQAYIEFNALPEGTSVNRSEMWAVLRLLYAYNFYEPLTIYCDNKVLVDSHNVWSKEWLGRELRLRGLSVFHNESVLELYRRVKLEIGDDPLELETKEGELVSNADLWDIIWQQMLVLGVSIELVWLPGHQELDWKDEDQLYWWNSLADTLAKAGRSKSYVVNMLIGD